MIVIVLTFQEIWYYRMRLMSVRRFSAVHLMPSASMNSRWSSFLIWGSDLSMWAWNKNMQYESSQTIEYLSDLKYISCPPRDLGKVNRASYLIGMLSAQHWADLARHRSSRALPAPPVDILRDIQLLTWLFVGRRLHADRCHQVTYKQACTAYMSEKS